jgi:membrane-associated phospholipid phosphatase
VVQGARLALRPVDRLLAGYLAFLTALMVWRGPFSDPAYPWLLVMHGLIALLLWLFTKLKAGDALGNAVHDLYPILLLFPLYTEIGFLNRGLGEAAVYANDAVVQGWEAVLFGGQISYLWIREYPSVFWSGLLHLAYVWYYPIVIAGPILLVARGKRREGRSVVLGTMIAFVACYVWFVLFPVAGPNYTFEHPTGPVREVWSARLVYATLAGGSSFGAAFPSSHVAATVAATIGLWRVWKSLAVWFVLPAALLTVGTIYCQMHYGVDATSGLALGVVAGLVAFRYKA